jgi:hypothetical protein
MTIVSPPMPGSGSAITSMVAPSPPPPVVIRSVQSDRDHAVLEVVGVPDHDVADELRQRVTGLLVAGVRYLLVDLSEAGPADAVANVLSEAGQHLEGRRGWLRVHRDVMWPVRDGLPEATPAEVFAIYQAFAGSTEGPNGRRVAHAGCAS